MLLLCGVVGVLGAMAAWNRRPSSASPSESNAAPMSWLRCSVVVMAIVLLCWVGLRQLVRGLVLPVLPISDAPIYHLYFAALWWKAGAVTMAPTPFGELAATYFPANGSLWFSWLMMGCESELLAKVGQWPFYAAGTLAVYVLARDLGAGAAAAAFPAVLWGTTQLCFWYSPIANVDLLYSAFYLCGAHFLFRLLAGDDDERMQANHALLFGLACGGALGTKTIALAFLPVLGIVFGLWLTTTRRRLTTLLIATAGLLAPAAFWYVRNFLATGNPLTPLEVRLLGVTVFPGWYEKSAMMNSGYHLPVENWRLLLDRLTLVLDLRIGWIWPLVVAATMLGGVRLVFTNRRDSSQQVRRRPWLLIVSGFISLTYALLYWFVLPYNSQERFLAPALGIGLAPLGRCLNGRIWGQWLCLGLVAWHLLTPQWATQLHGPSENWMTATTTVLPVRLSLAEIALPASLALAALWTATASRRAAGRPNRGRRVALHSATAALIVLAGCVLAGWPLAANFAKDPRVAFYPPVDFGARMFPAWSTLEAATKTQGGRVAYAGTNLPYYLFGSRFQNQVRYINVNAPAEWLLHDFHRSQSRRPSADPYPQWHREAPQYDRWLQNLHEAEIDYLFVARENLHGRRVEAPGPAPFPIEHQWAQQHPEQFELIGPHALPDGVPWAWVYRVRKPVGGVNSEP